VPNGTSLLYVSDDLTRVDMLGTSGILYPARLQLIDFSFAFAALQAPHSRRGMIHDTAVADLCQKLLVNEEITDKVPANTSIEGEFSLLLACLIDWLIVYYYGLV